MINIFLGKNWVKSGSTSARGYAFFGNKYYASADLANLVDTAENESNCKALIKKLNGCFAIVTERPTYVLAAVDRLRSIPLFYGNDADNFNISDDAYRIFDYSRELNIEESIKEEFLLTGYVTGVDTLYSSVKQLRSGELMVCRDKNGHNPVLERYYTFRHGEFFNDSIEDIVRKLDLVHQNVFQRLIESVQGRQIVLPLSGGHDSRLIGKSLRDLGAKNVLCYNYGTKSNWETAISKELADYLGFPWIHVPYSTDLWKQWGDLPEFKEYIRYAGNLVSVPHVQDWPAIRYLKLNGKIDPESVIVPGHTGDFISGGHIPDSFLRLKKIRQRHLIDSIYKKHYVLWDWPNRQGLKGQLDKRIESIIGTELCHTPEDAADNYELWELQERQAKFICNSVRVYDYFNYEWRLPLYDHELMEFWSRVPLVYRHGRKLYLDYVLRYQDMPITGANVDYGPVKRAVIRSLEKTGLKPFAKRMQRIKKRIFWKKEYYNPTYPPLGWYGMLDFETFGKNFTGRETLHSFMAKRYLNLVRALKEEVIAKEEIGSK